MIDIYKRKIDYIRISITDRCNLRCVYCMPEEGIKLIEHNELLSYEEIAYLCRIFLKLGINKFKITGGEPLVRKDCYKLVKMIKDLEGTKEVTLTTNGILLEEQIEDLANAGIDAINISIDTLREDKYRKITRVGDVNKVLNGIKKALSYKNIKVKINCVPLKGVNEEDIIELISLSKNNDLSIRFIEMMPIGLGKDMKGYSEDELKELIENKLGKLQEFSGKLGNGPSTYYSLEGYKGKIGFISAINHKFCDNCNRVRLTCNGFLKACLQYNIGNELKELLRGNCSEDKLLSIIENTIYNKPKSHKFELLEEDNKDKRNMSQIGG